MFGGSEMNVLSISGNSEGLVELLIRFLSQQYNDCT